MNKLISSALLIFSCITFAKAQNTNIITNRTYPQGYFRNPLNIKPDASGTFGELRSTHFHAGDDYRTQQKVGLPLYAAAEGVVSRIRVQIGGGGNSVYIDHPNGFTTVYLHMDKFNDELTNIVKAEQYKQERFDVDLILTAPQIKLTKGQNIGTAGNTGASGGPHLHFEIRDTKTQRPLNPQLFGLHFEDRVNPTIQGLNVYDLNGPLFNEHTPRRPQTLKFVRSGMYSLTTPTPIAVNGKFGLGISAIDKHSSSGFSNGVYSIELFLDGKAISTVLFEELDFNTGRSIHSYIDYPHFKKTKGKIQKSFKDSNNPTNIFHLLENNGVIQLADNLVHDVKYVVKDVHGNCSELNFKVQNTPSYQPKANPLRGIQLFEYDKENSFSTENIKIEMPKNVLYDHVDFHYSESPKTINSYSAIHKVHNNLTALFSTYNLSIRATHLPPHLQSKATIASLENGSEGGKYEDGWVTVNTRNFANFYVAVDTIAPTITPRNLSQGKNLASQSKIDFTISDNFTGIQSFNGYIDDKWVLMEYDPKNRHLWHRFDSSLPRGSHKFKLIVKDWKDNERIFEASFTK